MPLPQKYAARMPGRLVIRVPAGNPELFRASMTTVRKPVVEYLTKRVLPTRAVGSACD